jgi:DNA-binding IclR family transcriptional regulator
VLISVHELLSDLGLGALGMPESSQKSGRRTARAKGQPAMDAGVVTVQKGLRILEAIAEQPGPVALTDLVKILHVNKSTLYRFLATFLETGYLERVNGTDRYRLGVRVLKLAGAMLSEQPIREIASSYLVDLMLKTNEASHLTILDGADVVYLDKVDSRHPVRMYSYVGLRQPAHATASGKAMLAYLPEALLQPILALGMPARTANTITTERALRRQLIEIRRRGFAIDDEEAMQDIRCVGAPLFDFDARIAGAVSISAPASRMSLEHAEEVAPLVVDVAQQISARFGYRPTPFPLRA